MRHLTPCLLLLASMLGAQSATKLEPAANPLPDLFGTACDLDGDLAVIGAPIADSPELGGDNDAGAAYVYRRVGDSWIQEAILSAPTPEQDDHFGASVALDGETIVIGADGRDLPGKPDTGSVYVFEQVAGEWVPQVLNSPSQNGGDFFGDSVAIDAGSIVIGAPFDDDLAADSGAVYVFVRSGNAWAEQQKLKAGDASSGDRLGSVAILDDRIVAGAPHDDHEVLIDAGSVYVFVRQGSDWSQETRLQSGRRGPGESFGVRVAIDADAILVSSPLGFGLAPQSGNAEIFRLDGSTWSSEARLQVSDGAAQDNLGSSIDLAGDLAILGARFAMVDGRPAAGAAYLFRRGTNVFGLTTWDMVSKITSADPDHAGYGSAIAISGADLLVGAPFSNTAGSATGAAFVEVLDVVTTFGSACAGLILPTPILTTETVIPNIGETFRLTLSPDAPALPGAAIGLIGRSNRLFDAIPLPFDLGTILPGCQLLVSIDFQGNLSGGFPGPYQWSLEIPDTASLVGTSVFLQAVPFILLPGGGMDFAMSGGVRAKIGMR